MSHDRYFINRTATRILDLTGRTLIEYLGNYDYYLEKRQTLEQNFLPPCESASKPEAAVSEGKLDWQSKKEEQAKIRKRENDLKKCEAKISDLETELSAIDKEMEKPEIATDVAKLQELTKRQNEINSQLAGLYELWESLAE